MMHDLRIMGTNDNEYIIEKIITMKTIIDCSIPYGCYNY